MNPRRVSVVGLGKLGAPIAAFFASRGHAVVGIDVNARAVECVRRREPPVREPGLAEAFRAAGDRLTATTEYDRAVAESDFTFVVTATPSEPSGEFSLRHALAACRQIGTALRNKKGYHVVVLTSTVLPGSTGGAIRRELESASGRRVGEDFGLCYNPEFVALGSVLRDLRRPDFILIGESDPRAGDALAAFDREVVENDPPVARMNWVNAELTKLALNTFVTTKITFANMLARMCERIPGADVDVVTSALGLDSRIGGKYLRGGLGYGGPCFPRDNLALTFLARSIGAPGTLAEATDALNRLQADLVLDLLRPRPGPGAVAAVLGLAYKPGTNVAEESQGLAFARGLASRGLSVRVYDPAALEAARAALGDSVEYAPSLEACVRGASLVLVATPWDEFRALDSAMIGGPAQVVDCWRILDREKLRSPVDYRVLGREA